MKTFKIGDKVKCTKDNKYGIITVKAVFYDGFITGQYFKNGEEHHYTYLKISYLELYKSAECSEVLQLMDTKECSENYCKAMRIILEKYPNVNRAELEKELNAFI